MGGGLKSFSCQTQLRLCYVEFWMGLGFDNYTAYKNALKVLKFDLLELRRTKLTLNFGLKAENHLNFKSWFKPSNFIQNTR